MSTAQLKALGLTERMIRTRVRTGNLHRVFRGVYAVGHRQIGRLGLMHAAVLAVGRGAAVSHESAAELHGLWDRQQVLISITGGSQAGRKIQGIRWHYAPVLEPADIVAREGILCTSVARTLVDLAGRRGEKSLRRMVEQAAVCRSLDVDGVERLLAQRRRRGAPVLRTILAPWRDVAHDLPRLRSRLEARLLAAVVDAGLPRPQTNVKLHVEGRNFEVDLFWKPQRVVIETDGEETHRTRVAFRRDLWRDQLLTAAGYRTARVAWSHLEEEETATLNRIRRMLSA